jgi:hypothetical protein
MATVTHYDIKRAFINGAIVRCQFPGFGVHLCLPRGAAGDKAYEIWSSELQYSIGGTPAWPHDFDMVLFMLFLGERAVRP